MKAGGRRAGKSAELARQRQEAYERAVEGEPVLGADVLGCGCVTMVRARRLDGTLFIDHVDTSPCVAHSVVVGQVVRSELP